MGLSFFTGCYKHVVPLGLSEGALIPMMFACGLQKPPKPSNASPFREIRVLREIRDSENR